MIADPKIGAYRHCKSLLRQTRHRLRMVPRSGGFHPCQNPVPNLLVLMLSLFRVNQLQENKKTEHESPLITANPKSVRKRIPLAIHYDPIDPSRYSIDENYWRLVFHKKISQSRAEITPINGASSMKTFLSTLILFTLFVSSARAQDSTQVSDPVITGLVKVAEEDQAAGQGAGRAGPSRCERRQAG